MTQALPSLTDRLAFVCGVVLILIYSQGWLAPLVGYGDATEAGPIIRLIYFPAYLAGLFVLFTSGSTIFRALAAAPLLGLLMLVTLASTLWSVDPDATLRRFIAVFFTTLGGLALAARFRWPTLAEVVATSFLILAILSLVVSLALPDWGRMSDIFPGAWRGLWLEKNNLGGNMAVGLAACSAAAALVPKRRGLWIGAALLCLLLVIVSTSRTAYVVAALTLAALGLIWVIRRGPVAAVGAAWLSLVGLAAILSLGILASDLVFDTLGKDATLTGRTEIWDGITRAMDGRAWTGFGYGAIWDNTASGGPLAWITHYANFRAGHAHNGWMEIWVNIGLVGVIVFGLWFAEIWIRALWSLFTHPSAWLVFPALLGYSLTMLTESITLSWHDMRWVLFVAFAVKQAMAEPESQAVWAADLALRSSLSPYRGRSNRLNQNSFPAARIHRS